MQPVYMAPPPPGDEAKPVSSAPPSGAGTEADRLRTQYKAIGEEQKHTFGENPPGTKPVDFTKLGSPNGAQPAPSAVKPAGGPPVVAPAAPPPADAARRVNQNGGSSPGTAPTNPPANSNVNPAAAPPKQPANPAVTPSKQPASVPKPGASPGGQLR